MNQFRLRQERARLLFSNHTKYLSHYYLGSSSWSPELFFRRKDQGLSFRARSPTFRVSDIDIIDEVVVQDAYGLGTLKFDNAVTILDIGAHIGAFGWFASNLFDTKLLVAIEPESSNFNLLQENVSRPGWPPTDAVCGGCGISKHDQLARSHSNVGGHRFTRAPSSLAGDCRPVTLASIGRINAVSHWNIIKIDTEGREKEILSEIAAHHISFDVLLIEVHDALNTLDSIESLVNSLGRRMETLNRTTNAEGVFDIVRCS